MAHPRTALGRIPALSYVRSWASLVASRGALVQAGLVPRRAAACARAASRGLFLGGGGPPVAAAGSVAPAGGWMVSVILLSAGRPEGDFLFAARHRLRIVYLLGRRWPWL